jgi:hypothetical protein
MNWQGPVVFFPNALFSSSISLLPIGSFATSGRMIAAMVRKLESTGAAL